MSGTHTHTHTIHSPIPEPKRRKIIATEVVRPLTPISPVPVVADEMDITADDVPSTGLCPCGYLHGEGEHTDISAIGFTSVPLLRGPD